MVAMDATNNKKRGRSKIFACFKPPVVAYDHEPGHDSASPPFSGDKTAARRKTRLRRSFSAALKTVFFKTSLLKKSRSENFKSDGLRSNLLSKSKKLVNSMKKGLPCKPLLEPEQVFGRTNSNRSSLFSSNTNSRAPSLASSSSVSSCSSHSRSGSAKIKRSVSLDFMKQMNDEQKTMRRDCGRKWSNYNLTIEICVVWVCLFALVWGKVFAIVICTSTLLFFAPANRRRPSHRPQKLRKFDSFDMIDSGEYKKRVIMEGLLERNR